MAKLIVSPSLSIAVGKEKLQLEATSKLKQGIESGVPICLEKIGGVL